MRALCIVLAHLGCTTAAAAECDRFAVAVATDPAPYQYPHGLEKAHALHASVPASADVMLVGDSLAANWPDDMAQRQFKTDHVWNFAVGGSVIQNILWQLGRLKPDHLQPQEIVVIIGTNNLTREDMPACAIAAGIKAVVNSLHKRWPGAIMHVMGIPPRGTNFRFRDEARLAVNAAIKMWGKTQSYLRYFEVDASEITCGRYDKASAVGRCENYADDFGHFKRTGYEVIFSSLSADRP